MVKVISVIFSLACGFIIIYANFISGETPGLVTNVMLISFFLLSITLVYLNVFRKNPGV